MEVNDIVERSKHSTTFNNVKRLQCTDKKRFLECEVTQEGEKEFEGRFKAQDVSLENGEFDDFSTSANKFDIGFSGDKTCKLYKENEVLRCRNV